MKSDVVPRPVPTVLHVVIAGAVGGAERMLADLASSTTERHVAFVRAGSPALLAFLRDAKIELVDAELAGESPLHYVSRALGGATVEALRRAIRTCEASVVQVHTIGSHVPGTRAAMAENVPLVRTEHSTRAYDDPSVMPLSRWSLGRADAVACVSEHIASVVRKASPAVATRVHVVPNGVDAVRFAVAALPPRNERDAHAPFTFALLGRLEPRKGVDVALAALALVPHARLLVVGDGPSRAALVEHAHAAGVTDRVEWLGHVSDPRAALARAHVMLSASRKEALGLALLEGMAMGRPAVAPPTGGIPEFVNAATGWLASDMSPTALARAMRECMQDTAFTEKARAAAQLVRTRYTQAAMQRGYRDIYTSVTRAP